LRKGTLGENEKGVNAKFPHPQFIMVLVITVLGGSLFINIIMSMINALVCDFSGSVTQKFIFYNFLSTLIGL
jgi:hypothetical protein